MDFEKWIAKRMGCMENFDSEPSSVQELIRDAFAAGRQSADPSSFGQIAAYEVRLGGEDGVYKRWEYHKGCEPL